MLALRFPGGSYRATPWDHAVNEAVPEWPPSPWRLLRALYATWKWRAPELGEEEVRALFSVLSSPPMFHLPRHTKGHTRHYFPDTTYGTDKVFDPCVLLDRDAPVVLRWEEELTAEQEATLRRLCDQLGYLGRAESICEATVLDDARAPATGWVAPGSPLALADAPAWVLVPALPLDLGALTATTAELRKAGRRVPPGSRWVPYSVPLPAEPPPRRRRRRSEGFRVPQVAVLALDAAVMPSVLDSAWVGDVTRRAVLSRHELPSVVLAGKDGSGTPLSGHRHAHYIPLDRDSDGFLDAVAVWAPDGLGMSELAALSGVRRLWSNVPGFRPVRVALEAFGDPRELVPELCAPRGSRLWWSVTPFVPYRHRKRHQSEAEFLGAEVARELATRGLPEGDVTILPATGHAWLSYRRQRPGRRESAHAVGLRLSLAESIEGPVVLGALSHFGLGIFRPDDGR
ncbi:MAG: type I-G CRISPR-associated protein Csb2 [Deltaproteobacteria bacterium]